MRTVYSYIRLTLACCVFLGGIALQFVPTAAVLEREARLRSRLLQSVPAEEREGWLRARDLADARSEAYLHLFGVLLGGVGLGMALFEAAYVCARYSRHCPLEYHVTNPAWPPRAGQSLPEEDTLLGTVPDRAAARRLGRTKAAVTARRERKGIPPVHRR
jgi:hypothetical protein